MNIQRANLVDFFYITDEFCKGFDKTTHFSALSQNTSKAKRNRGTH